MASKIKNKQVKKDDGFESVAKRLECDEDKDKFERQLGKIAKATPPERRGPKKPA